VYPGVAEPGFEIREFRVDFENFQREMKDERERKLGNFGETRIRLRIEFIPLLTNRLFVEIIFNKFARLG